MGFHLFINLSVHLLVSRYMSISSAIYRMLAQSVYLSMHISMLIYQ